MPADIWSDSGRRRPLVGVAYRREAMEETYEFLDDVECFEVTADHYVYGSPRLREAIVELSRLRPIVAHGVGLSIGTAVRPDGEYLDAVAEFLEAVGSPWYSEHLAFTKSPRGDVAQLLPLPRTAEVADVLVENIEVVRQHIPVPLVFENISYYFDYPAPDYDEPEFLQLVLNSTGSTLLLDVENLYINARNFGFDPVAYIDRLPPDLVRATHLAGGSAVGSLLVDTHDRPVPVDVFTLLDHLLRRSTPDTVIVERDDGFEDFGEVRDDVRRAAEVVAEAQRRRDEPAGSASGAPGRSGPDADQASSW